jgi:Costars/LIM domain
MANEKMAERQQIRARRGRATQFVDNEIRAVIVILQKKPGRSVTYGALFDETQETMSALSATLAVARKRQVVKFEGSAMLLKGQDDHVVITLLKDEIVDTEAFVSVYGLDTSAMMASQGGAPSMSGLAANKCHMCNKTVYPTERVAANGKVMHKACFRCCECRLVLKLANYSFSNGKFFCTPHYKQAFQSKGYNF